MKRKVLIGRLVWDIEARVGIQLETLIFYERKTKNSIVAKKLGVSRQVYGLWKEKVRKDQGWK
jgi:hypothetical protein